MCAKEVTNETTVRYPYIEHKRFIEVFLIGCEVPSTKSMCDTGAEGDTILVSHIARGRKRRKPYLVSAF